MPVYIRAAALPFYGYIHATPRSTHTHYTRTPLLVLYLRLLRVAVPRTATGYAIACVRLVTLRCTPAPHCPPPRLGYAFCLRTPHTVYKFTPAPVLPAPSCYRLTLTDSACLPPWFTHRFTYPFVPRLVTFVHTRSLPTPDSFVTHYYPVATVLLPLRSGLPPPASCLQFPADTVYTPRSTCTAVTWFLDSFYTFTSYC